MFCCWRRMITSAEPPPHKKSSETMMPICRALLLPGQLVPGQLVPRENHSRSWPETLAAQTYDQVVHAVREEWSPGRLALEQRLRGNKPSINLRADRRFREGGGTAQEILRFGPGLCRKRLRDNSRRFRSCLRATLNASRVSAIALRGSSVNRLAKL